MRFLEQRCPISLVGLAQLNIPPGRLLRRGQSSVFRVKAADTHEE
jgi:hypothetical protein